jgi:M26 IgA1-specific Metallo-endopeptidase N-terminal region
MRAWLAISTALVLACAPAAAAVKISSKPTKNMSCAAGICTPTAGNANLNATDLTNMLASADTSVQGTSQAKDIEVDAELSWISTSRLTLAAYRNIEIDRLVSIKGSGALTLATPHGGDLDFEKTGRVAFWDMGSSLVINGAAYTLEPDFTALAAAINANPQGNFALANDDKVRKKPFRTAPIGATFEGTLEGLGNTVTGLRFEPHADDVAVFTQIGSVGAVRDLSLAGLSITAKRQFLDAMAGLVATNFGFIDDVHVSGTIDATNAYDEVSGLLGATNFGNVTRSSASGSISMSGSNTSVGGLFGESFVDSIPGSGTISWSYASVDITGSGVSGGLVGQSRGTLTDCYATGNVTGEIAGGLVADFQGTLADSFATGNAHGGGYTGGLFGAMSSSSDVVRNSYATGAAVSDGYNSSAGGLAGLKIGVADETYSIGAVTTAGTQPPGGLLADDTGGTTSASVWDMDTSGIANPSQGAGNIANDPGIMGLSDAALKSALPSGFDPAVWGQSASINNGYPYLLANPPPR